MKTENDRMLYAVIGFTGIIVRDEDSLSIDISNAKFVFKYFHHEFDQAEQCLVNLLATNDFIGNVYEDRIESELFVEADMAKCNPFAFVVDRLEFMCINGKWVSTKEFDAYMEEAFGDAIANYDDDIDDDMDDELYGN